LQEIQPRVKGEIIVDRLNYERFNELIRKTGFLGPFDNFEYDYPLNAEIKRRLLILDKNTPVILVTS